MPDFPQDTQLNATRQIEQRGSIGSLLFQGPLSTFKAELSLGGLAFTGIYAGATGSLFSGLPWIFLPTLIGRGAILSGLAKKGIRGGTAQISPAGT